MPTYSVATIIIILRELDNFPHKITWITENLGLKLLKRIRQNWQRRTKTHRVDYLVHVSAWPPKNDIPRFEGYSSISNTPSYKGGWHHPKYCYNFAIGWIPYITQTAGLREFPPDVRPFLGATGMSTESANNLHETTFVVQRNFSTSARLSGCFCLGFARIFWEVLLMHFSCFPACKVPPKFQID